MVLTPPQFVCVVGDCKQLLYWVGIPPCPSIAPLGPIFQMAWQHLGPSFYSITWQFPSGCELPNWLFRIPNPQFCFCFYLQYCPLLHQKESCVNPPLQKAANWQCFFFTTKFFSHILIRLFEPRTILTAGKNTFLESFCNTPLHWRCLGPKMAKGKKLGGQPELAPLRTGTPMSKCAKRHGKKQGQSWFLRVILDPATGRLFSAEFL